MSERTLYFPYPGFPLQGGYYDFMSYNQELVRLQKHLTSEIGSRITYFCIGAPWEERSVYEECEYSPQQHQVFPEFLVKFTRRYPEYPVDLILISPNQGFKDCKIPPTIISETYDFEWEFMENTKTYQSSKYNTRMMIFYTMMPSYVPKMVSASQTKLVKFCEAVPETWFKKLIPIMIQGKTEKDLIDTFYQTFDRYLTRQEKQSGQVFCFSFAVFCRRYKHNHYKMFPELPRLIKLHPGTILAEWYWTGEENLCVTLSDGSSLPFCASHSFEADLTCCLAVEDDLLVTTFRRKSDESGETKREETVTSKSKKNV